VARPERHIYTVKFCLFRECAQHPPLREARHGCMTWFAQAHNYSKLRAGLRRICHTVTMNSANSSMKNSIRKIAPILMVWCCLQSLFFVNESHAQNVNTQKTSTPKLTWDFPAGNGWPTIVEGEHDTLGEFASKFNASAQVSFQTCFAALSDKLPVGCIKDVISNPHPTSITDDIVIAIHSHNTTTRVSAGY
jgi:hypothetical protein